MKRYIFLCIAVLMLCGCANVKDMTIEDTLNTLAVKNKNYNVYRVGYKYYLPRGLQIESNSLYNEVLTNNSNIFYLYIDMVSYFNKKEVNVSHSEKSFYSKNFVYNNKSGYLEINKIENNKYLIEIMYNYAKIEVMVNEKDINPSLIYAINVLKSIKYNDKVIANMLGDDKLSFSDEEYNIFKTTSSDSNYLNYDNTYVESSDDKKVDQDLLK